MIWTMFKEKTPVLGSNIVVTDGKRISIIEYTLKTRQFLLFEEWTGGNFYEIDSYSDDPEDPIQGQCLHTYECWAYPSQLIEKR